MIKLNYIANLRLPTEKAYGIQIAEMCQAFTQLGHSVRLTAPDRKNLIQEDFFKYYGLNSKFTFEKISSSDFYLTGIFKRLEWVAVGIKSLISAFHLVSDAILDEADIYYFRDELPAYLMSFKVNNSKIIFEAHKFSRSRKFWYRRFKNKNIKIITITHGLKNQFLELGFKNENILVASDGVDLEQFDSPLTKEEARRGVIKEEDLSKKIVMYCGHLFDWKGANILAEAASRMPEVVFYFVGGTESDRQIFLIKYLGEKNIRSISWIPHDEVPDYLKAADVLVLPNKGDTDISKKYTSPLKLFEYMASGQPIVASDLPSIREILNEKNAVLVKPTPEAISEGIKKIFSDPDLGRRISGQAFEDVKQYSWKIRAQKILNFIS